MPDKEKPLPKPPNKAFGRKNNFEPAAEEAGSLLADRMAAAAAEGRLDDFLKKEMPDNEYARNLANMMMGMTGMVQGNAPDMSMEPSPGKQEGSSTPAGPVPTTEVPEDVRTAIMGGDLEGLMGLLRREHQKRNAAAPSPAEIREEATPPFRQTSSPLQQPTIDKETIDSLVQIASENSVTLDWIILRAIRLYVQEYGKTGKL